MARSFFGRRGKSCLQSKAHPIESRAVKIIDKYMVKELIPPFLLGLMLFTFILLINRIFKLTELIVNKGVSPLEVARLVSYIMPSFLTLTIPMAVLLATLVAFGRLSTDSEITALRATGFPFYRLMAPVLVSAVLMTAVTAYFSIYLGPKKARTFKRDVFTLAKTRAFIGVEEEVFNGSFKNIVIYTQKTPSPNEMEGVFISDERNRNEPYVIIAKRGVLDMDLATGYAYLNLQHGSIHKKENKSGSYQEINFDSNTLSINLYEKFFPGSDVKRSKREMTLVELRDMVRELSRAGDNINPLLTEYYKRFTIPLACIVFGIVGPPLGLFSRRSGKSSGITVALVVFAVYYLLMKGGENLAAGGDLPPLLAALLPNVVIGALGVYLAVSANREKNLYEAAVNRLRKWRRARGLKAWRGGR